MTDKQVIKELKEVFSENQKQLRLFAFGITPDINKHFQLSERLKRLTQHKA